jgi:hypothetical protein
MELTPYLAATLSLLSLSFAAPAPAADASPSATEDLVPRACTTIQPSFISCLDSAHPNQANSGLHYRLSRSGGPGTNNKITVMRFDNIPAGSTGCMLTYAYPANKALGTGSTQADLFGTKDPVSSVNNWNNKPVKTTQWASLQFPNYKSAQPFKTTVMSNTCSSSMSFLLELSD